MRSPADAAMAGPRAGPGDSSNDSPSDSPPRGLAARRTALRDRLIATLRASFAEIPPGPLFGPVLGPDCDGPGAAPGTGRARVVAVWLYGSWARGDFDGLSDVDLLLLTDGDTAPPLPSPPAPVAGIAAMVAAQVAAQVAARFAGAGLPGPQRWDTVTLPLAEHRARVAAGNPFHTRLAREAVPVWDATDAA